MKTESLTVREALERGIKLPWALIRSLSQVTLGPIPTDVSQEELIEARFFDADEEIRVFHSCGKLQAVRLLGEPGDNTLERTYEIENPKFGKKFTVRYLLEADEDGQTCLATARLTGWEGAK